MCPLPPANPVIIADVKLPCDVRIKFTKLHQDIHH